MTRIHTHYDNLKVARNAPPEIIRAAYKLLAQKYHPDRNPNSADAIRVMSIINTSYEVLSDANKRQEHDLWVAEQELVSEQAFKPNNISQPTERQTPQQPKKGQAGVFAYILRNWAIYGVASFMFTHVLRNWAVYGVVVFLAWIWAIDKPRTPLPGSKPYQASPSSLARPHYVQPNAAPNGQPWPATADYVRGYPRQHTDGLSSVTVDNSQNDSNVFVKLVSLDSAQAYPVRQFFIPAFGSFALEKVTAGSYDIRYRDLSNGGLSRSEAFNLDETKTYSGTQFSNITMTLYKVKNGNMQTYGLTEGEF